MKNYYIIRVDSFIDLITNSSSELFVIENKMAKSSLVELVNSVVDERFRITEFFMEDRLVKEQSPYETDVDMILNNFPLSDREILRKKYFSTPNYYAISYDRDNVDEKLHNDLIKLGFELIDSDY